VPVLHAYQPVTRDRDPADARPTVRGSYPETPGIQVLACGAPDWPPRSDTAGPATWLREYEYQRLGTRTLLAGLDLATGEVLGLVRPRHRRREFVACLAALAAK